MRFKLICCDVFTRIACMAAAKTQHIVDPEFTPLGAHESPEKLRELIQGKIYEADSKGVYDAVLLGFGLCGNAVAGIKAGSIPLVIPRAHDCCTLFIGSREKFLDNFKDDLSSRWSSAGYMERGTSYLNDTDTGKLLGLDRDFAQLVEQYGEENAEYIWETLHPKTNENELIYIDVPELSGQDHLDRFKAFAEEQGKTVRVIEGNARLILGLVDGAWNDDEYLVVPPGKEIKAVYDHEEIITVQ